MGLIAHSLSLSLSHHPDITKMLPKRMESSRSCLYFFCLPDNFYYTENIKAKVRVFHCLLPPPPPHPPLHHHHHFFRILGQGMSLFANVLRTSSLIYYIMRPPPIPPPPTAPPPSLFRILGQGMSLFANVLRTSSLIYYIMALFQE